ncbi:AAA family ATPase [Devosia sp.]|uniref:AAA family ATPase n=1 Tax=Devosia sp. TaxID=1871048 RepID=UPI0032679822
MGITYVACKQKQLSVGETQAISLDALTKDHMNKHHQILDDSSYYFQPFKSVKEWVSHKYPSSGLQAINTQTFGKVFNHPRNSNRWGFVSEYEKVVAEVLRATGNSPAAPLIPLAIWLYKFEDFGPAANFDTLVDRFISDYHLTSHELDILFSRDPELFDETIVAWQSEAATSFEILTDFSLPPDASPEAFTSVSSLSLENVGPATVVDFEPGERLTIVTGDNGLGKSFLLEAVWWATTTQWAERQALPSNFDTDVSPMIHFEVIGKSGQTANHSSSFEWRPYRWSEITSYDGVQAIALYSRADGSFAAYDPVRGLFDTTALRQFFSPTDAWEGNGHIIQGLIKDWVQWKNAPDQTQFKRFCVLLQQLSPIDLGELSPGEIERQPRDARLIPTLKHKYGTVPITHLSSGVKRVLILAYLISWIWQEHEVAAEQQLVPKLTRFTLIIDELEAHLHPKWQRTVLPALLGVAEHLSDDLSIQTVVATHSPMILASMETHFDDMRDALYHLSADDEGVELSGMEFRKYGNIASWLTSPVFGLKHARSTEAEVAIEKAKRLQLAQIVEASEVSETNRLLLVSLAEDDSFWPRWISFAEAHGVRF